jgi:UDP-N-acetylmuramoylalanine--D-glutamate ligase
VNQFGFGWDWNWSSLRVAVVGLGKSGFAAADTLHELGAAVTVLAEQAKPEFLDLLEVLGIPCQLAENSALAKRVAKERFDLIIASPGIAPHTTLGRALANSGSAVWGEVDLAWRLGNRDGSRPHWVTVTGTNGKTTITEMTNHMLLQGGLTSSVCGNIGTPVLDVIRADEPRSHLVVELSSFQLHYMQRISPLASLLANIAEDHLDWHGDWDSYVAAKARIYENTQLAAVYNTGASITEQLLRDAEVEEGCRAIGFGLGIPGPSEVGYVEEFLVDRAFLDSRHDSALEVINLNDLSRGAPNSVAKQNMAAATALARAVGVAPRDVRDALISFRLSPHRQEKIASAGQVSWINDSKATNAHAADSAISQFDSIVWIAGGLLKGVDISPLVSTYGSKLRALILIGTEPEPWRKAVAEHAPKLPIIEIADATAQAVMTEAVRRAADLAKPGDTVLLAPAAASMDQFQDYAERGEMFRRAVQDLLAKQGEVAN